MPRPPPPGPTRGRRYDRGVSGPPIPEPGPAVDDGLARPRDVDARYGAGVRRGLVLGGGGIVFVAWQLGSLLGAAQAVEDADAIGAFLG